MSAIPDGVDGRPTRATPGDVIVVSGPIGLHGVVSAMHDHEHGREACVIGRVTDRHSGVVTARTTFGATRVVALPLGEQLPRIC